MGSRQTFGRQTSLKLFVHCQYVVANRDRLAQTPNDPLYTMMTSQEILVVSAKENGALFEKKQIVHQISSSHEEAVSCGHYDMDAAGGFERTDTFDAFVHEMHASDVEEPGGVACFNFPQPWKLEDMNLPVDIPRREDDKSKTGNIWLIVKGEDGEDGPKLKVLYNRLSNKSTGTLIASEFGNGMQCIHFDFTGQKPIFVHYRTLFSL